MSLALWRMDTELAPIIAEEVIRPPAAFRPAGSARSKPPPYVLLQFEARPKGYWLSPQISVTAIADVAAVGRACRRLSTCRDCSPNFRRRRCRTVEPMRRQKVKLRRMLAVPSESRSETNPFQFFEGNRRTCQPAATESQQQAAAASATGRAEWSEYESSGRLSSSVASAIRMRLSKA